MIWQILFATSDKHDADLETIEIEADSKSEAVELASLKCPKNYFISDIAKKRGKHGGARLGAGQPSKYGEPTKVLRLPESLVDKRDLIIAIPELQQLLDEWEQDCADNPSSARRYFLKQALADIRTLGF